MITPVNNKTAQIPALTGIRFVAVAMIFLHHNNSKIESFGSVFKGITNQFYLGVQIFFILSGFLIAYRYFEQAALNRNFLSGYFLRRFTRIYPLYFIVTSLFFLHETFYNQSNFPWKIYFLNITFLKGFSSQYLYTGIYQTWTLTVEETFYILAPFIFVLKKNKNIFALQIIFYWLIGALLLFIFTKFPFQGFFSNFILVFHATFFGRCFEFFVGIWLAFHFLCKYQESRFTAEKPRPVFTYLGIATIILIIVALYLISIHCDAKGLQVGISLFTSNILFPLGVAIFFYGLIKERSLIRSILSTRVFQILGRSSYAFFLIHTEPLAKYIETNVSGNLLLTFVILQVISIIIYRYVEKPVGRWLLKKGDFLFKKNDSLAFTTQ